MAGIEGTMSFTLVAARLTISAVVVARTAISLGIERKEYGAIHDST
jgi:hypothetical protein